MKRLNFRKLCYILAVFCFVSLFVKQSYDAVQKFASGKTGYHVDLKVKHNLDMVKFSAYRDTLIKNS